MYSKGIFGQFYPVDSLMHKINSSVKIVCLFIVALLMCFTNSLAIHLFVFALIILMILLTKVPFRYFFNLFYNLKIIYILLVILGVIYSWDINLLLIYILKVVIIFENIALISYTTSISELSYGIEKVLEPFNLFNFKLGNASFFITSLIKIYPMYIKNKEKLLEIANSKNIIITNRFLVIDKSLKNTFKQLHMIKTESTFRLFNYKRKRTNINHNKLGFYDIILLVFHILFLLVYIVEMGLLK